MKSERQIKQQLAPELPPMMIARVVRDRGFRIVNFENGLVFFEGMHTRGSYNTINGELQYIGMTYPRIIEMFNSLHKTQNENKVHIFFTVVYSVLLFFFLAVSSFFLCINPTAECLNVE